MLFLLKWHLSFGVFSSQGQQFAGVDMVKVEKETLYATRIIEIIRKWLTIPAYWRG